MIWKKEEGDPICVDIVLDRQLLDMRPHPEDRADIHDTIEQRYQEKNRRCKCGRINT